MVEVSATNSSGGGTAGMSAVVFVGSVAGAAVGRWCGGDAVGDAAHGMGCGAMLARSVRRNAADAASSGASAPCS